MVSRRREANPFGCRAVRREEPVRGTGHVRTPRGNRWVPVRGNGLGPYAVRANGFLAGAVRLRPEPRMSGSKSPPPTIPGLSSATFGFRHPPTAGRGLGRPFRRVRYARLERHPRGSNQVSARIRSHRGLLHHGHHRSSTPGRFHWRGSMGSESTVYRIGNPKCRSNHGDYVPSPGDPGIREGRPRFRGSTPSFLDNEGEVRGRRHRGRAFRLLSRLLSWRIRELVEPWKSICEPVRATGCARCRDPLDFALKLVSSDWTFCFWT